MSAILLKLLTNECRLAEAAAHSTTEVFSLAFGDPHHATGYPKGVRDDAQLQQLVDRLEVINALYRQTDADPTGTATSSASSSASASGPDTNEGELTSLQQAQLLVALHPEKHASEHVHNFLCRDDLLLLQRTMPSRRVSMKSSTAVRQKQTAHISSGLHRAELMLKRKAGRHSKDASLLADAPRVEDQVRRVLQLKLVAASYDYDIAALESADAHAQAAGAGADAYADSVINSILRACCTATAGTAGGDGAVEGMDEVSVMLESLTCKERAAAAERRLLSDRLYAVKDSVCCMPEKVLAHGHGKIVKSVRAPPAAARSSVGVGPVLSPLAAAASPSSSSIAAGVGVGLGIDAPSTDISTAAGNSALNGTGAGSGLGFASSDNDPSLSDEVLAEMGYNGAGQARQREAFDESVGRVRHRMRDIFRKHECELENIHAFTIQERNKKIKDIVGKRREMEMIRADRISTTIEDSLVELVRKCQVTRHKFRPIFRTAKEEVVKQYDYVRDTVYGDKQFDAVMAEREEKLRELEKTLIENDFVSPYGTPSGNPNCSPSTSTSTSTRAKKVASPNPASARKSSKLSKTEIAIRCAQVGVDAGIGNPSLMLSAKIRLQMEQQQTLCAASENGDSTDKDASASTGEVKADGDVSTPTPAIKAEDLALPWWVVVDNELQELHSGLGNGNYAAQMDTFQKASEEIVDYANSRVEKVFLDKFDGFDGPQGQEASSSAAAAAEAAEAADEMSSN